MEHNETEIKHLMERLIFLLNGNDAKDWGHVFEKILYKFSKQDKKEATQEIVNLYKGGWAPLRT